MAKKLANRRRPAETAPKDILFDKQNYILIGAGLFVVIIGFILMAGGGSTNPDEWKPEEIYSFRRITLAPIVVLLGLGVVILSIFKTPKHVQQEVVETINEEETL